MDWVVHQISNTSGQIPLFLSDPTSSSSSYLSHYFIDFQSLESFAVPSPPPSPPVSSSSNKISPSVLFIIVIVAVIFFISGLLHLLIRFLVRQHNPPSPSSPRSSRYPRELTSSDALQRQLQQLFHLHDSGLDQAFIDALPVFLYKELVGVKEPFDCAVCLCEFADEDKLRLLPLCSHAFHISCIDTWLLSNSTCPLCRGSLFIPGFSMDNPVFDCDDARDDGVPIDGENVSTVPGPKPSDLEEGAATEKMVFPVRLGKFRSLVNWNNDNSGADNVVSNNSTLVNFRGREEGESSSSSLDARRCYSMGSFQYVVGDSILQVALSSVSRDGDGKSSKRREGLSGYSAAVAAATEGLSGKRLCVGNRGESFSVSKIWQWSNQKGKFPISSDTASLDGNLSWLRKNQGDT